MNTTTIISKMMNVSTITRASGGSPIIKISCTFDACTGSEVSTNSI